MSTTINSTLGARLALLIDLQAKATEPDSEANPLNSSTIEDLAATTGVAALNMAAKYPRQPLAYDLEVGAHTTREAGKDAKAAHRKEQQRARAARKMAFDEIAESDVVIAPKRMRQAWLVVEPMTPIVTRIALDKQRWAARYLGSVTDDVAQVVLERIALILGRSDRDLDLLARAAAELGEQVRNGGIPGEQMTDEERAERKAMSKARKWLMGMIHNRVQGALCDLYVESRRANKQDIDIIATTMASINGIGGDPMLASHRAARAPGFLGARFQAPNGIDQGLIAQAINAAITDRGLDSMADLLLDDENRRSDGSIAWTKVAERIFLATPERDGNGEWLWDLVVRATDHHAKPKRARADAARQHCRNLFEWLPAFIVQVVDSFTWTRAGYGVHRALLGVNHNDELVHLQPTSSCSRVQAVMVNDFEQYLGEQPEVRQSLQPALTFASVEAAVEALTRHLDIQTSSDFMNGLVNA